MKPASSATPFNRTAPASPAGIHEIEEEASAHASPSHSPAQSEGALTMLSRRPSKRGKETADVTASAAQSASHLQSVELQVSQPAVSPNTGNASLVRLKEQLAADNLRPVEPELAAELINKTRPMKLADATGPQERAATHADLLPHPRDGCDGLVQGAGIERKRDCQLAA